MTVGGIKTMFDKSKITTDDKVEGLLSTSLGSIRGGPADMRKHRLNLKAFMRRFGVPTHWLTLNPKENKYDL